MEFTSAEKKRLSKFCILRKDFPGYKEIMKRHTEAVNRDESFYVDPKTGSVVFTASYLYKRGSCCGSGCRHCPFGEE